MNDVVAVLTTWERPDLLQQTLPRIESQLRKAEIPLVIADDNSKDPATVALLEAAMERGATIVRPGPSEHENLHPHFRIGRNFVNAVRAAATMNAPWILKIDDDAWLENDAVERLLRARDNVIQAVGPGGVLAVSGIVTTAEGLNKPITRLEIARTSAACSVFVLHQTHLLTRFVDDLEERLVEKGWDSVFFWEWAPGNEPRRKSFSTIPSVAYHMAHTGVHLAGVDVNRPKEDLLGFKGRRPEGVGILEHGEWSEEALEEWRELYGREHQKLDGSKLEKESGSRTGGVRRTKEEREAFETDEEIEDLAEEAPEEEPVSDA